MGGDRTEPTDETEYRQVATLRQHSPDLGCEGGSFHIGGRPSKIQSPALSFSLLLSIFCCFPAYQWLRRTGHPNPFLVRLGQETPLQPTLQKQIGRRQGKTQ
jgi:hypothetical protein